MSDIVESLEHQLDEFDSGKAIHFDYSGLRALIAEIRCLREENAALRAPTPFSEYPNDHARLINTARRICDEPMSQEECTELGIELASLVYAILDDETYVERSCPEDLRLLRQAYTTLAFAFARLHGSARSRDGELCLDFQKVRSQIEARFKQQRVKL